MPSCQTNLLFWNDGFCVFSSRRRHTSFSRDWSSDVCSSDLRTVGILGEDRQNVPIKNIKVQNFDGPGDSGVRFSDHSSVVLENVHCDNCYNGWFMLEIGRASCREREWYGYGARLLTYKIVGW